MTSVVFKVSFKEDLRRWTASRSELNIALLERKIRDLYFPTAPSTPFITKYVDEDGDLVTVETQDDLDECLSQANENKLRLFVHSQDGTFFVPRTCARRLSGNSSLMLCKHIIYLCSYLYRTITPPTLLSYPCLLAWSLRFLRPSV